MCMYQSAYILNQEFHDEEVIILKIMDFTKTYLSGYLTKHYFFNTETLKKLMSNNK